MINVLDDWYTRLTGDPFTDIGGFVLEYLHQLFPEKSIMQHVEWAANVYVKKWSNNLHSFFLNSTITHNSNKGQKGIDKTLAYYNSLLSEDNGVMGYCRVTGQFTKVFQAARDNHIMSGSATLINFHHGFESGLQLSKEALIRIFFVPLGVEQLGDKVAAVICNAENVTRYIVRYNVDENLKALGSNSSTAIVKSDYHNPANALFNFATRIIDTVRTATYEFENETGNATGITLTLYHFTNFGASPSISIYTLPSTVFSFYSYCIIYHNDDWQNFIRRQYTNTKVKNTNYDSTTRTWYTKKGDIVDFDVYKTWYNKIYEALLSGNSRVILRSFLSHSKRFPFSFKIIEQYQIKIRNMDKRTIAKIKELADFIIDDKSDDEIKRTIVRINKQKSSSDLRRYFLKLIVEYNNKHSERSKPLITVEEYVDYLFPDGSFWSELRDLLLIAVYQKLHELNKQVDIEIEEQAESENSNI